MHPGELLREDSLIPMGITAYRLAKDAKLPHQRVGEVLHERRGVTADSDLHLCACFGLTPIHWLRVQLAYDLREAMNTVGTKIKAAFQSHRPNLRFGRIRSGKTRRSPET